MLRIGEALLVEGRYDKHTLAALVDTLILTTDGFGIFKNEEKKVLLRRVADKRGLIVLTDSDGAGFVIRNHLKGVLPKERVKHAYIPDIAGKERRKDRPSKEGKLGVEGMRPDVLERSLRQAGATFLEGPSQGPCAPWMDKATLYEYGLSGGPDAASKRKDLLQALDLPEHLSATALVEVLNTLYGEAEGLALLEGIGGNG